MNERAFTISSKEQSFLLANLCGLPIRVARHFTPTAVKTAFEFCTLQRHSSTRAVHVPTAALASACKVLQFAAVWPTRTAQAQGAMAAQGTTLGKIPFPANNRGSQIPTQIEATMFSLLEYRSLPKTLPWKSARKSRAC